MSDQETDEQAMAQMMGFSAFGAQDRPQKKRKYNPSADAATNAQQPAGTGSNMTPLAARPAKIPQAIANLDEIDLEDGDDPDDDDGGVPTAPGPSRSALSAVSLKLSTQDLPQRSAPAPGTGPAGSQNAASHNGQDTAARQHHCWWQGYYDTLSNRNPWEKLEKSLGLQPRGIWLSHAEQSGVASAT